MKLAHFLSVTLVLMTISSYAQAQSTQLEFTPNNGFSGYSSANGTLRLFLTRPRPYHVENHGFQRGDGRFQLNQTVTFQGRAPRNRYWVMTLAGPQQYTATLSDAVGPVVATTDGNRLLLRYRIRGPLVMHQTLRLNSDGRTIANQGRITLLGLPVGHLQETIIRRN